MKLKEIRKTIIVKPTGQLTEAKWTITCINLQFRATCSLDTPLIEFMFLLIKSMFY